MLSFPLQLKNIDFYSHSGEVGISVVTELKKLDELEYELTCNSRANNYLLSSDLDEKLIERLETLGNTSLETDLACETNIKCDLAVELAGKKVIFEIEKADRRKILYDLLKAHIYLRNNFDFAVIMVPKNWVHSGGVINLFQFAIAELDLCVKYKMFDPEVLKHLIIVGFTQVYEGKTLDLSSLRSVKGECRRFFT